MFYKRIAILLISLLLFSGRNLSIAETKDEDDLIKQLCLASFKMEMEMAGINPPKSMGIFTCDCFANEMNLNGSFIAAKSTCQKKASEKFNLETQN